MWLYWLVREPNAGEKRRTAVAGGDGEAGGVQAPRVIWPSLLLFWMRCDAMRCVGAEAQAPLSLSLHSDTRAGEAEAASCARDSVAPRRLDENDDPWDVSHPVNPCARCDVDELSGCNLPVT